MIRAYCAFFDDLMSPYNTAISSNKRYSYEF